MSGPEHHHEYGVGACSHPTCVKSTQIQLRREERYNFARILRTIPRNAAGHIELSEENADRIAKLLENT